MKNKKKKYILLSGLAVLLVALLSWVIWENVTVGLTEYTVMEENLPAAFDGCHIAHVSDLHNSGLWKKTAAILQEAKPDIICITGDIVDYNRTNIDTALAFAAEAVKIAPCYYITGNHELLLETADYDKLIEGLKACGVIVLEDEAVMLERNGQRICLAGVSWGSMAFLGELALHEEYTILLAHGPENFESYAAAGYDLVLSGHVHGGQFRLPFVGGLYGPGQGLFPKYDSGVYSSGDTDMVVSRGIGNSVIPVRFNNRPEVILITLTCA